MTPLESYAMANSTLNSTSISDGANGTSSGDSESNTDMDCNLFTFINYVVVFGTMCVFGLFGNTISFLVLQWEKQNHVATFLLQVMALADNLFLLTTGFSQIFTAVSLFIGYDNDPIMPYIMVCIWPLVHVTQLGTVWITVLIAFNRFIAICRPFQATKLCTMRRVRLQVFLMTLFCVLYNIPRFLEYRIEYVTNAHGNVTVPVGKETDLKSNDVYNITYENVLYCLIVFLAPLVILIYLNACLIRELWRARQRLLARQLPSAMTAEDEEQNLTLVMIVIVLIFLVCQTPATINQLLFYLLESKEYQCGRAYFYYYHISNLLVSANSSVNFVVYCAFRKQFRERLVAFCRRDRRSLIYKESYAFGNGQNVANVYCDRSDINGEITTC